MTDLTTADLDRLEADLPYRWFPNEDGRKVWFTEDSAPDPDTVRALVTGYRRMLALEEIAEQAGAFADAARRIRNHGVLKRSCDSCMADLDDALTAYYALEEPDADN